MRGEHGGLARQPQRDDQITRLERAFALGRVAGQSVKGVANISSLQVVRAPNSPFGNDPFLRYFFGDGDEVFGSRDRRSLSLGSGVLISPDGYVITNNHVVGQNVSEITVALSDKREIKGRVIGVERTCSDPGGHPEQCHEAAQVIVIEEGKKHTTLASEYDGKTFWRMGELVCDSKGGVYFTDDNGTYFVNAAGKVSLVAGKELRTNGMVLSRDEKTLYVTNRNILVAFDIKPDGTTTNRHDFAKLEGGGKTASPTGGTCCSA